MISINKVDLNSIDLVSDFLESVPSIKNIEVDIVKNAIYATEDSKILGVVSYEKFNYHGLVRYFVFKKTLDLNVVIDLFDTLTKRAIDDNLIKLYSVVNNNDVENLFKELGFALLDKDLLYIDECQFQTENNINPKIMEYNVLLNC